MTHGIISYLIIGLIKSASLKKLKHKNLGDFMSFALKIDFTQNGNNIFAFLQLWVIAQTAIDVLETIVLPRYMEQIPILLILFVEFFVPFFIAVLFFILLTGKNKIK